MAFGQIKPTQTMAGPVATGQAYAQQIAGGMPMEQVIAPGVSYSPEDPMGYTQADLDLRNRFKGEGPALVMPVAPTKGTPFAPNEGFVQMPSAPQGVAQPTRFGRLAMPIKVPGIDSYDGTSMSPIPEDFIQTIDRSRAGLLGLGFQPKQEPEPESIRPSLFDIDVQEILKDVEILKDIDTEKFADIDFSNINIPPVVPTMPMKPMVQPITEPVIPAQTLPQNIFANIPTPQPLPMPKVPVIPEVPVMPEPVIQKPITPVFQEPITPITPKVPVMPRVPVIPEPVIQQIPEPVIQQPVRQEVPFVPEIPTIPMNFTGLPQMPVIPNIPVMPELPIVPQPIPPMNLTRLSNLPVSNFVQPSVEEIVSPISRGRTLPQAPRGLFSL